MANKILNLMSPHIVEGDDGMTLLHHLFVNYDCSIEAD